MSLELPHLGFVLAWIGIICWLTLLLSSDYEDPYEHERTIFFLGLFLVIAGLTLLLGGDTFF